MLSGYDIVLFGDSIVSKQPSNHMEDAKAYRFNVGTYPDYIKDFLVPNKMY